MKDSHQILVIVLIFLVFLSGFFYFSYVQLDSSSLSLNKNGVPLKSLEFKDAIATKYVSNCYLIENKIAKESCISKLEICTTDDCNFNKAFSLQDATYCYKIKKGELQSECHAKFTFNSIIIESVQFGISFCDKFEQKELQDYCRDNYNLVQASNFDDISFCSNIVDSSMKNNCLERNQ